MTHLRTNRGFTLVEMLIIAPIVILAISAFVLVIVNMTGEVVATRANNAMVFDVQNTLNKIDKDVRQSTRFLAVNSVPVSSTTAQGYNNNGTNFTNEGGTSGTSLILNMVATDKNPDSLGRSYIYLRDQPSDCSNPIGNIPLTYNMVYFVRSGSLWQRTIMPTNYTNSSYRCNAPWQLPSCSRAYMATASSSAFCKVTDIELVKGVTVDTFNILYYPSGVTNSPSTVASNASASDTARNEALDQTRGVKVTITAKQLVSGRDIEYTASVRSQRIDPTSRTF